MTTRQQAIFNPAQFKAPATEENEGNDESGGSASATTNSQKEYPVTGNATRDQVRKLIFESFTADQAELPNQEKTVSQLVEEIENDIFEECKDPKSKQYRDRSRAVQMKLKGARFEQTRNDLRCGRVKSKIVIRDDFVQGKNVQSNLNPVNQPPQIVGGPRPPMMAGGPRPPMGMRPPGPGGPMMRPRLAGPPGGAPPMFRPPPVQMVQLPPQPIEEPQSILSQVKSPSDAPVPFDDAPLHLSRQSSDQQQQRRDFSPPATQQFLHPQPPSSTDVHIDERPQLDHQEEEQKEPISIQNNFQATYPLDTSSNLLQTSADNIGVSFEDDAQLMNPGKKKGKKKKKKGKKPGDSSQDTSMQGIDNQEGFGFLNDEDHQQQISVIEEEKEDSKAEPEESGLRAQITELAPISGVQNNEILNMRKQESEEFIYPNRQEEDIKNITALPGTIDERVIGIPSSSTHSEMRIPSLQTQDAEEGTGGLNLRQNDFNIQGYQPEVQIIQTHQRIVMEEEIKQDQKLAHQQQNNRILNDLYEDQDEQTERRGIFQRNSQDQTGNEDLIRPRLESQDQPSRLHQENNRQFAGHLGTRTSSVKSLQSLQPSNPPNQHLLQNDLGAQAPIHLQNDTIKRLQDAINDKRAQKKQLSEQLVHLENNCQLQTKKATMLLEENKSIRSELRQKDREIQNLKMQQDLSEQQLKLQIKTLERQLREKTSEIDQLKKEAQRRKEKEDRANSQTSQQFQQLKDRQAQSQQENEQQLSYLQNLLRSLDQRIQGGQGNSSASQGTNNNNGSSLIEGAGASNYQQQEQMMESVQKEMREMKQIYESRMRELNEQLQDRMRNLQRVERQNVQLMEKNIKLSNLVQSMEVQQLSTLSTVAGSGSNQRDAFLASSHRGMRGNTEEGDDSRPRQMNNNNPTQSRFYQIIGENDEGTGGLNHQMMRNQQEFGYGDDGMAAPVVSGGGAMGAGGGVGTTASQLYNNDGYDDDEGFNEGNNQMRGGSGGVGSVINRTAHANNLSEVVGSGGGAQHMIEDAEEDEDQDLEEEGDEEDNEEERDDDYDHQIEGEGDFEGVNGGAAGAGGLDEEDQEEADEDAVGMDEEDEGFGEETLQNIEEDAEGAGDFDNSFPEEGNQNVQGRVKGAARGLRTHHNHNMQGSGHSHSNSQSAHYIDSINSGQMIDGGSYSSFVPPVSGGAGSTRLNPVRAAGPAAAGNTRRTATSNNNEERKGQSSQGPRRGNKQQNQQHSTAGNNATGSGGSSNMQNPRQRNTRGRQQRSNQQHVQQQPINQVHNYQEGGMHVSGNTMMMPGATPSSNIYSRVAGGSSQNHEYFQSYGDSSTHYNPNNNNSRDQSITQTNPPREGAAGGGVVHTVTNSRNAGIPSNAGMENSMMSAESGSTALLDRGASGYNNRVGHGGLNNNFNPTTGVASMGGQARGQPSSIQHLQSSSNNNQQQQFQPMQYLGTAGGQSVTDVFSQDSSSAAPNNDSHISYTAAVGAAPPQSRAAAPRQQRNQQHQQNNQQNAPLSYYQGFEESKNESNLLSAAVAQSSTYSNNNQMPTIQQQQPMRNTIAAAHSGSQNNNQAQLQHNQYSMLGGSSGEQEEDSYSGLFSGGAGSGMMAGNHIATQYGGSTNSNHTTANGFERVRNQQPQPPISGSRLGFHHDQSHNTPTRNDSRKTSGANTPNKDGADTPTTKAYRHQQNPFVQVHNLTSSHLFFNSGSNQDESENPFSNNNLPSSTTNQQTYSNQQQLQFGRVGGGAGPNNGGPSGGGIQEADVINGSLFDS